MFTIDSILDFLVHLDSGIGILFFIFIYVLVVLLILPASWLSLAAGYLYGLYYGTLIVFISAFLGASISFLLAKNIFSKKISQALSKFSKLSLLEKIVQKGGLKLFILTRLSPLFPFSILNYFYGLNKVSFKDFSISLLFILPGTFLYCSVGSIVNDLKDINNVQLNNNLITTLVSLFSTILVIYFLTKYSNEVIQISNED